MECRGVSLQMFSAQNIWYITIWLERGLWIMLVSLDRFDFITL